MIQLEKWEHEFMREFWGPGWEDKAMTELHRDELIRQARDTTKWKFANADRAKRNLFTAIKEALKSLLP